MIEILKLVSANFRETHPGILSRLLQRPGEVNGVRAETGIVFLPGRLRSERNGNVSEPGVNPVPFRSHGWSTNISRGCRIEPVWPQSTMSAWTR